MAEEKTQIEIRDVRPDEYVALGRLTVDVYRALPGMPGTENSPEYYAMLEDTQTRVEKPTVRVLVAVDRKGELLGGVTFIGDMKHYDSGGTASTVEGASGIRLLAVGPNARGMGVGRALTEFCIAETKRLGRDCVVLHTTKAMEVAWDMYERMGFQRASDLDFLQGELAVYGFELSLE